MTIRIRQAAALLAVTVLLLVAAPAQAQTAVAATVDGQLFPSDPPVIRG